MSARFTDRHRLPRHWKRSLAGAMLVLVQCTLAGCGGGGGGDSTPAQPPGTDHGQPPAPPVDPTPPSPPPPLVCDDKQAGKMAEELAARAAQPVYVDQVLVTLRDNPQTRAFTPTADRRLVPLVLRVGAKWNAASSTLRSSAEGAGPLALGVSRAMSGGAVVLSLGRRIPVEQAQRVADLFAGEPEVLRAEPDLPLSAAAAPSDPYYGQQWNLFEQAGGIGMPDAWSLTTGRAGGVTAVLDTGVLSHADLAAGLLPGYNFVSGVGSANNGIGRSPNATDPGDWVTQQELDDPGGPFYRCQAAPSRSTWHGTRVAGLIGAGANNGIGIAGIDWQAKILPVRVLGKCGGATSDIADGMRWAAGLPVDGVPLNPYPARILNLSLGGRGPCGSTFQSAIDDVLAKGAVVVVAAGNDGAPAENTRPANCRGVITVASNDRNGLRAWDSNYGSPVTLSAPGASVLSTANSGAQSPMADAYLSESGTSFAAPQVSGIVSLMLAANPTLTSSQVTTLLRQTARPSPQASNPPSCLALPAGAGIVDAPAAISAAKRDG
jgi:serine protease